MQTGKPGGIHDATMETARNRDLHLQPRLVANSSRIVRSGLLENRDVEGLVCHQLRQLAVLLLQFI